MNRGYREGGCMVNRGYCEQGVYERNHAQGDTYG